MKNIIKAALASTVCILSAAVTVQAQSSRVIVKGAQAVAGKEIAAKAITGPLHSKFWYGATASAAASGAVSRAPQNVLKTPQMPKNALPKTPVKVKTTQLKAAIERNRVSRAKRERALLVADVLWQRDALVSGYYLPENFLEGFFFRRIYPYQSKPTYTPDKDSDQYLYRGMLVTPEELATILRVGFSPKTSTWNAGTGGKNAVSLSSSVTEALHYIFQSGAKKDGLGIVFQVRRSPSMELGKDKELNCTQTIYYSFEDIPASAITDVYVYGEFGLEFLNTILQKAKEGTIKPNTWTNQFDRTFF